MKLNNSKIFSECVPVSDKDFDDAVRIGFDMVNYAKSNNFAALTANQVGYDMMVCAVRDNDGYDVYINPEIEVGKLDGEIVMDLPKRPMDYKVDSFPDKRLMLDVVSKVHVNAYSVNMDERIDFDADGILAEVWQVVDYLMDGVKEEDLYNADFRTIKGSIKKKRNAKCPECGLKNKKCICK